MARQQNDGRGRLGGRQKGTPNKTTSTLREIISQHWQEYQESKFKEDLDALDPATRITVMERYAQYIAPKMKSVDMEISANNNSFSIEDHLRKLCEDTDCTKE